MRMELVSMVGMESQADKLHQIYLKMGRTQEAIELLRPWPQHAERVKYLEGLLETRERFKCNLVDLEPHIMNMIMRHANDGVKTALFRSASCFTRFIFEHYEVTIRNGWEAMNWVHSHNYKVTMKGFVYSELYYYLEFNFIKKYLSKYQIRILHMIDTQSGDSPGSLQPLISFKPLEWPETCIAETCSHFQIYPNNLVDLKVINCIHSNLYFNMPRLRRLVVHQQRTLYIEGDITESDVVAPLLRHVELTLASHTEVEILKLFSKILDQLRSFSISTIEARDHLFADGRTYTNLTRFAINQSFEREHVISLADLNQVLRQLPNLRQLRLEKMKVVDWVDHGIFWPPHLESLDLRHFTTEATFSLPAGLKELKMIACSACLISDTTRLERVVINLGYRFEPEFKKSLLHAFENENLRFLAINRIRGKEFSRLSALDPSRQLIRDRPWLKNFFRSKYRLLPKCYCRFY